MQCCKGGLSSLQQLQVALIPKQTVLLPNYPNPFSIETWIPYHLAHAAEVTFSIYDIEGVLVRQLRFGASGCGCSTRLARRRRIGTDVTV